MTPRRLGNLILRVGFLGVLCALPGSTAATMRAEDREAITSALEEAAIKQRCGVPHAPCSDRVGIPNSFFCWRAPKLNQAKRIERRLPSRGSIPAKFAIKSPFWCRHISP